MIALAGAPLDRRVRAACSVALIDHGDPRGKFLALDAALAETRIRAPRSRLGHPVVPGREAEFRDRQAALDELARGLDPAWVARVGALSHRRLYPWRPARRPGEPPTLLAGGLREADLQPLPAGLELDNVAATLLQSLRWALPGPVLEIAVHDGDDELNAWVSPFYWCTNHQRKPECRERVVELRVPPPGRPAAIRLIRDIVGCNLRSARDMLEALPCVLLETLDGDEARVVIERVAAAGGQAAVRGEDKACEPAMLAEGAALLEAGAPVEVVVRADAEALEVRDFVIRWAGPHTPERAHVLRARWRWHELPADPFERLETVRPAIEAAVAARRAKFIVCSYCHETTSPEWRFKPDVCSTCAEKHLGVTY